MYPLLVQTLLAVHVELVICVRALQLARESQELGELQMWSPSQCFCIEVYDLSSHVYRRFIVNSILLFV